MAPPRKAPSSLRQLIFWVGAFMIMCAWLGIVMAFQSPRAESVLVDPPAPSDGEFRRGHPFGQRIRVEPAKPSETSAPAPTHAPAGGGSLPKVMYAVYPSGVEKHMFGQRTECIRDTWGKEEKLLMSNGTDWRGGAWLDLVMVMRQAVASGGAWDWFFRGDEMTWPRPKALTKFLGGYDHTKIHVLGNVLQEGADSLPFIGAGAGIAFSRAAVEAILAGKCDEAYRAGKGLADNAADVFMGRCYMALTGEKLKSTRQDDGEVFNVYGPVRSTRGELDDWYQRYKKNAVGNVGQKGAACCSARLVTFYYVDVPECKLLWEILSEEGRAKWKGLSMEERLKAWPSVFGHSRKPKESDTEMWPLLLEKIEL